MPAPGRPPSPLRARRTTRLVAVALAGLVLVALGRQIVPSSVLPTAAAGLDPVAGLVGAARGHGSGASASIPGTAGLAPDLRGALERAAGDAADAGVVLRVTSGRRSPERQRQLLQEAIVRYGSEAEARRWVATPETSAHVSGDAVDIGPVAAAGWLGDHGAGYGLCRVYDNEPWHFELRPEAADRGCPPTYADPTRDPRMRP